MASDLRELNELNFARFDAKLEQRLAELDAKWERRFAQLEIRIAAFEARIVRWMFTLWVGTTVTIGGVVVAAQHFR